MQHNHNKCNHKLEYCDTCDKVYCKQTSCNAEWSRNLVWNTTFATTTDSNSLKLTELTDNTELNMHVH